MLFWQHCRWDVHAQIRAASTHRGSQGGDDVETQMPNNQKDGPQDGLTRMMIKQGGNLNDVGVCSRVDKGGVDGQGHRCAGSLPRPQRGD